MKIALLDGHNHAYRHFHGKPEKLSPAGMPVQAIQGWIEMLFRLFQAGGPEEIFSVFDPLEKEEVADDDYKGHRAPVPPELEAQFPVIIELARCLGTRVVRGENGEEGDQLIASLVYRLEDDHEIGIYTIDKDLAQLVSDRVTWMRPAKEGLWDKYGPDEVYAKFQVWPNQMADYLLMVGDKSDNLAGVPSIGPKIAADILGKYESIDKLVESEFKGLTPKKEEAFRGDLQALEERRKLVELVPHPIKIPDKYWLPRRAQAILTQLGLGSLAMEIKMKGNVWRKKMGVE